MLQDASIKENKAQQLIDPTNFPPAFCWDDDQISSLPPFEKFQSWYGTFQNPAWSKTFSPSAVFSFCQRGTGSTAFQLSYMFFR